MSYNQTKKGVKLYVQPIGLVFRYLQSKKKVEILLVHQPKIRIQGYIIGFDEYLNLVIDQGEEHNVKSEKTKKIGLHLLKGENILFIRECV
ncbi:hypothetical protein A3Q56_03058 [Intoshia linei]|uniref:Small nuclear ribonucleoprotein E n=1 Tax=Intoshia linei TaxID=1819745 RepID=A0A177B654_9BILA|nr:hypothetical protein A3Q56_03058 [Intoshia linei]